MSFLSPGFLAFFPVAALFYFCLPARYKNAWLLACSFFFYLCAGVKTFGFLLFACVFTYFAALRLEKKPSRLVLALALGAHIGLLFVFKYLGFALSLASRVLRAAGLAFSDPALSLLLPLGISFYLFAAMGYLIDVYRRTVPAEHSFVRCALFISFFPSLLSGPIPRSTQLLPQFQKGTAFSLENARRGAFRFMLGAFLKLCAADRLGAVTAAVFSDPAAYSPGRVLAAAVFFSLQIYFDFFAYSEMACGCAEVLGFSLIRNFRTPYFSRSVQEFWRRWHISLSTWFRDYLYIPLGGSRRGSTRRNINVLIVFAVSGLWHGAALSFVVWGLLNGLYQVLGSVTAGARSRLRRCIGLREDGRLCALWQTACTFALATAAWVFFKAGSLRAALAVFCAMSPQRAGMQGSVLFKNPAELWAAAVFIALCLALDLLSLRFDVPARLARAPRPARWGAALTLLLAVFVFGVYGTGYDAQDFIYFKF